MLELRLHEPDPVPPPRPRSTVSPEIARILQEEADRERATREAEARTGIESQPDLGLEAPLDREAQQAEEARRRMARMRGEAAPAIGAAVTAASGTRRELLPDIEEINSSLRSASERQTPEELEEIEIEQASNRRGSRFGFTFVVLVFAALSAIYILAPRIGAAVPQAAPALDRYVVMVDEGRIWLDLQMQKLLAMIDSDAAQSAPPGAATPETTTPETATPQAATGSGG